MSKKPKGERTVIAFDFGTISIGVAIGNEITKKGTALEAIPARDGIPQADLMDKVFATWQPDYIVVGLPLNMDGTYQEVTYKAKKFANRLGAKYRLGVYLKDERLSTKSAREYIFEQKGYAGLTKGAVDSQSAVEILEGYFQEEHQNNTQK